MGLFDFFKNGHTKLVQEKQKAIFVQSCEDIEALSAPAPQAQKFSVSVINNDMLMRVNMEFDEKSEFMELDKTKEGFSLLRNFINAYYNVKDLQSIYFVSEEAMPNTQISLFRNKNNTVTFSVLTKRSAVLKQSLLSYVIPTDLFEKEFMEKIKREL